VSVMETVVEMTIEQEIQVRVNFSNGQVIAALSSDLSVASLAPRLYSVNTRRSVLGCITRMGLNCLGMNEHNRWCSKLPMSSVILQMLMAVADNIRPRSPHRPF
jgi:hypothetical protein